MALWQGRSKRKVTGGRYRPHRGKKKNEIGREQQISIIGKESHKLVRTMGGNSKSRVLVAEVANVFDPKSNKTKSVKIKTVLENPANPNYVRRNIMTRTAWSYQRHVGLSARKVFSWPRTEMIAW
jgi:small subunit ribosomal protein S8e